MLTEDANVGTDLIVQPGRNVIISGDAGLDEAPRWGSGGFAVGETARLSLKHLVLQARVAMTQGATALSIEGCVLDARVFSAGLTIPAGTQVSINVDTPELEIGATVLEAASLLSVHGGLQSLSFLGAVNVASDALLTLPSQVRAVTFQKMVTLAFR